MGLSADKDCVGVLVVSGLAKFWYVLDLFMMPSESAKINEHFSLKLFRIINALGTIDVIPAWRFLLYNPPFCTKQ